MPNPFYEALSQTMTPNAANNGEMPNLFAMLQQFKTNPIAFIAQKKLHLKPNINMSDPNAMLSYLVSSGQVPQSRVDWAKQQLSSLRGGQ